MTEQTYQPRVRPYDPPMMAIRVDDTAIAIPPNISGWNRTDTVATNGEDVAVFTPRVGTPAVVPVGGWKTLAHVYVPHGCTAIVEANIVTNRADQTTTAVRGQVDQAEETLRTLAPMFEGLHRLIATSSRDWGEYRVDAWLWAVLLGWDCEEDVHDETCVHGTMAEMQQVHGWDDAAVAKARRYRAAVRAVEALVEGDGW